MSMKQVEGLSLKLASEASGNGGGRKGKGGDS